jgi:arylsulfatase A
MLNRIQSVVLALCVAAAGAAAARPNIVIIFVDDMGYGDMSCNGHPTIRTPNLDRMAAEGQKWTSFYSAASVCTPSRAALMTGRLPVRSGMCSDKRRVLFPESAGGLPDSETTLAEMLKTGGYATGMVGKWHLGHLPQYLPVRHGFDSWYGIPYSNDMDRDAEKVKLAAATQKDPWKLGVQWTEPKSEYWNVPLMDGETLVMRAPDQELLTRNFTERAVAFIRENTRREAAGDAAKPFFLYLAHSMPHVPLFRSETFKGVSTAGLYGDVIEELDWSVGEILQTLRAEGVAEKTLVLFTSDNGPWIRFKTQGGIAGPLREGKGCTWEGGMRMPALFWWPGTIKPGIVHDIGSTLDMMATLASLTGARLPASRLDSYDLSGTLRKGAPSPRSEMFFYRGTEIFAIRSGSYKLHYTTQSGYKNDRAKHDPPLLYNLDLDPGENYDVASAHPEIIEKINQLREKHEATVEPVENQLEKR